MKTSRITRIALFTALMAVSVWVVPPFSVPGLGVPFTLQSLFVVLAGFLLAPVEAFVAMLAYLALGAAGLPVFSGGQGGLQVILGPTGGFLLLFPAVAATIASFREKSDKIWVWILLGFIVAVVFLYPLAVIWTSVVTQTAYGVLLVGMIPYAIMDVLKIVIAAFLSRKIDRALHHE
ncbi:MAG TPA: hypothetical protein DCR44_02240 [Acholeplasmatales bacterium]|nr:MAG: hypothetical protein A2Y16_03525 [Tenericutes bacterium GWF2_57_13]HAQ56211.1 hypothetical protein [Acholeplasmatales bacterium]